MAEATPPTNSIDVVFALMQGRIAEQNTQIGTLDGKANFALGSAKSAHRRGGGAPRGAHRIEAGPGDRAAAWRGPPDAERSGPPALPTDLGATNWLLFRASPYTVADVLAALAVVTYVAVIGCAIQAYQLRRYTAVPEPKDLIAGYLGDGAARPDRSPEYTKERVARTLCDAFYDNVPALDAKIRWTKAAIWSLAAEAVVLVLLTLAQSRLS
jgi:hypothetical protein